LITDIKFIQNDSTKTLGGIVERYIYLVDVRDYKLPRRRYAVSGRIHLAVNYVLNSVANPQIYPVYSYLKTEDNKPPPGEYANEIVKEVGDPYGPDKARRLSVESIIRQYEREVETATERLTEARADVVRAKALDPTKPIQKNYPFS